MNRRYALIGVAVLVALLMVGVGAIAGESLNDEGPLKAPSVSLGEPGLSFRYVETFGVTEAAYVADVQHLNGPEGLFIDGSDNLYVVEEYGARMLKYRISDGTNLMSIGTAGLNIVGDDTFYQGSRRWQRQRLRGRYRQPSGANLQQQRRLRDHAGQLWFRQRSV